MHLFGSLASLTRWLHGCNWTNSIRGAVVLYCNYRVLSPGYPVIDTVTTALQGLLAVDMETIGKPHHSPMGPTTRSGALPICCVAKHELSTVPSRDWRLPKSTLLLADTATSIKEKKKKRQDLSRWPRRATTTTSSRTSAAMQTSRAMTALVCRPQSPAVLFSFLCLRVRRLTELAD